MEKSKNTFYLIVQLLNTHRLFPIFSIILITTFIRTNAVYSYERPSDKRFLQKYNLIDKDPIAFLKEKGINVEDDLIKLSDLQLIMAKPSGAHKGGVYFGNGNTYFVKDCNTFNELVASKLMNLIVGTKCTPIVKIVKDQPRTGASLALPGFKMYSKVDKSRFKKITGEVDLAIAMGYVGLVDGHRGNLGYVRKNSKTLRAARVDFDASFDFESNMTGVNGYTSNTDHLDLKHLYTLMDTYPKRQVKRAIKKIVNIPDEQIIRIVFQSWAALSQTPTPKPLDNALNLMQRLIERKNAFRQALAKKRSKREYEKLAAVAT